MKRVPMMGMVMMGMGMGMAMMGGMMMGGCMNNRMNSNNKSIRRFGMMKKSVKIDGFLQKIAKNESPLIIKNKKLVDGKGSFRVAQEILKIWQ